MQKFQQSLLFKELESQQSDFTNFITIGNERAFDFIIKNISSVMHVFGAKGTGKTHLLQAWISAAQLDESSAVYFDVSIAEDKENFLNFDFSEIKYIAIDNIEVLSIEEQVVVFDLYNLIRIYGQDKLLLTSSTLPIMQCGFREDLRSRLIAGLVIKLNLMNNKDLIDALLKYVKIEQINISDANIYYLVNRNQRDLAWLIKLINYIAKKAIEDNRSITKPFIRLCIEEYGDIQNN